METNISKYAKLYLKSNIDLLRAKILWGIRITKDNCYERLGANSRGYSVITINNNTYYAHVIIGLIDKELLNNRNLKVLHKCDNPSCVNSDHLFLGTDSDNVKDSVLKLRHKETIKTRCPKGHEYYKIKTIRGKRICIKCRRIYDKKRRPRKINY